VGGPLVAAFGTYVPIPNAAVGARYGVSGDWDLDANVYLLPLAYHLIGFDVGMAWYPVDTDVATLVLEPRAFALISFKEDVNDRIRLYPAISATYSTEHDGRRLYAGIDVAVIPRASRYDPERAFAVVTPLVGCRWELGRGYRLLTELKWLGVNIESNATVDYVNPGGLGGLAPAFGLEVPW